MGEEITVSAEVGRGKRKVKRMKAVRERGLVKFGIKSILKLSKRFGKV